MSKIQDILARMQNDASAVKVASADTDTKPVATQDAALSAVRDATQKLASAATSSAPGGTAIAEVQKIAADQAAADEELQRKLAFDMGQQFTDGVMQRMAAYEAQLPASTKTASAAELEKVAAEAYAKGAADFEKEAAAEIQAGYDQAVEHAFKTACELHMQGQEIGKNFAKKAAEGGATRPFA